MDDTVKVILKYMPDNQVIRCRHCEIENPSSNEFCYLCKSELSMDYDDCDLHLPKKITLRSPEKGFKAKSFAAVHKTRAYMDSGIKEADDSATGGSFKKEFSKEAESSEHLHHNDSAKYALIILAVALLVFGVLVYVTGVSY